MTAELVAGLVALIVALVGGSVGWQEIKDHGAETERRKQAEVRADHAEATLKHRSRARATRDEWLRRAQARLARLRNPEAKR